MAVAQTKQPKLVIRADDVGVVERTWWQVVGPYGPTGERYPDTPEGHTRAVAAAKRQAACVVYSEEQEKFTVPMIERRIKIRWRPGYQGVT